MSMIPIPDEYEDKDNQPTKKSRRSEVNESPVLESTFSCVVAEPTVAVAESVVAEPTVAVAESIVAEPADSCVVVEPPVPPVLCAICMGSNDEDIKLLENHNCPVCSAHAWHICEVCDENLLSRTCPICNSDYAPRVLHVTQGLPVFPVTAEDLANLQFQRRVGVMGKLACGSNVVVWCPEEELMHFFLPQEFTNDVNSNGRSVSVTIGMTQDKIIDNQFRFDNKIWDELLKEMEEGLINSDEILTSDKTLKKIFFALHSPGSQFLTQLKPEEWDLFIEH